MARKPKLKKFKPLTKVSEENMAIRERVEADRPERMAMLDEFYKDAELRQKQRAANKRAK